MKKAKRETPQQAEHLAQNTPDDTKPIVDEFTAHSFDQILSYSYGAGSIFNGRLGVPYDVFSQNVPVVSVVVDTAEHEKTRMLISEKLELVAKKDDVIQAKEDIIDSLTKRVQELQEELKVIRKESSDSRQELCELRRCLQHFAPPKRFFRVTLGFFLFFLISEILGSALGLRIVEPFWAFTGVVFTTLVLVVIYFAKSDIEERLSRNTKS